MNVISLINRDMLFGINVILLILVHNSTIVILIVLCHIFQFIYRLPKCSFTEAWNIYFMYNFIRWLLFYILKSWGRKDTRNPLPAFKKFPPILCYNFWYSVFKTLYLILHFLSLFMYKWIEGCIFMFTYVYFNKYYIL